MTITIEEVDVTINTKPNMITIKIILIEADRREMIMITFRKTMRVSPNILQMKAVSLLCSLLTQKKETRKNKYLLKDRAN